MEKEAAPVLDGEKRSMISNKKGIFLVKSCFPVLLSDLFYIAYCSIAGLVSVGLLPGGGGRLAGGCAAGCPKAGWLG